jgi:hypothetical protein
VNRLPQTILQAVYNEFDALIDQCEMAKLPQVAEKLRRMRDHLPFDPDDLESYEVQEATGAGWPQNKSTAELLDLHEQLSVLVVERGDPADSAELQSVEEELERRRVEKSN